MRHRFWFGIPSPLWAGRWVLWSLLLGVLLLPSCATPVGVKRVDTQEAHRLLTTNVLATGTASELTMQVLTRLDLVVQFTSDPAATLAELHGRMQSALDNDQVNNRLFALAELSFLYAERQRQGWKNLNRQCVARKGWPCPAVNDRQVNEQSRAYYLAAVVYAYAFLFPEKPTGCGAHSR